MKRPPTPTLSSIDPKLDKNKHFPNKKVTQGDPQNDLLQAQHLAHVQKQQSILSLNEIDEVKEAVGKHMHQIHT